jgi:hypothetical protein
MPKFGQDEFVIAHKEFFFDILESKRYDTYTPRLCDLNYGILSILSLPCCVL